MDDEKKLPVMCSGSHCAGKNPALPPHGCPYQQDVNNSDDEEYCTCCNDCAHECAMDI